MWSQILSIIHDEQKLKMLLDSFTETNIPFARIILTMCLDIEAFDINFQSQLVESSKQICCLLRSISFNVFICCCSISVGFRSDLSPVFYRCVSRNIYICMLSFWNINLTKENTHHTQKKQTKQKRKSSEIKS